MIFGATSLARPGVAHWQPPGACQLKRAGLRARGGHGTDLNQKAVNDREEDGFQSGILSRRSCQHDEASLRALENQNVASEDLGI